MIDPNDPRPAAAENAPARLFRIFISSPGDLGEERVICARVVERLKGEFARAARLQAILWEQEPLTADLGFQEQIPLPSQTDIVVLLLWSRLGYRLHSRFKAGSDEEAPTGTIFEFRDAINARRDHPERVPDVLVYRKTAEPPKPSITDEAKYLQALEEWRRVEAFFNSEFFRDAKEGVFTGAFHTFKRAGEFEENFERHLRAMIVRRLGEDQSTGPGWTRGSPFRGLERFDFEHRELFAGRARAAAEVLDALRRRAAAGCAFVMITGMSGGGKSSLALAGVLPDLIQPGVIEGIGLWRRAVLRPGEAKGDIVRALAEALLPRREPGVGLPELAGDPGGEAAAVASLTERLRQNPGAGALLVDGALRQAADAARAAEREKLLARRHERAAAGHTEEVAEIDRQLDAGRAPQARLALVIDQMEELFTAASLDAPAREAFLLTLDALARDGRTWVIATLRSDFFAQCEANPTLIALKAGEGTYHLLPPSEAEIYRMISQPASAAGLQFERDPRTQESLSDVLLAAAARDPGALPLLEFTLDELYKRAAAENRKTLLRVDYDALGGLEGALATRAEAVFAEIQARDPGAAETLPTVFGVLARLAPTADQSVAADAAAVVSQSAALDRFAPAAATLVRAMIEARLLVSDKGQVRVAHEALLRHWGRARDWIAENRDFLRVRVRVGEAAARWRTEGEPEDFLLPRGKPLAEGEDLLTRRRADLAPEEIAFIEASSAARRRQERAAARRRRRVLTAISSALVAALIFAAISFWQYGKAEAAARRATHARNEAEKLIEFMGVDLRDKLAPIGRLELLDSANQRVRAYYQSFSDSADLRGDRGVLSRQSTALLNEGDILRARGNVPGAVKSFREAEALRQRLAQEDPANADWQGDLAIITDRLGEALRVQGDLSSALATYRRSLELRQKLAAGRPDEDRWQREVATSWKNIGDALVDGGELPKALEAYRASLALDLRSVQTHPGDVQRQHDLFTSKVSIGDVLRAQNDLPGALASYREAVVIQQKLVEGDPRNAPWQRDLAVSLEHLGDAQDAQGDHAGALSQFRGALAVHQRLAAQDPTNAVWKRELSVGYARVGDLLLAANDTVNALEQYHAELAIAKALAESDPTNTSWQRDLSVALERVGQGLETQGDLTGAARAFQDSLEVRRRLAAADASNADRQHDVFVSLTQMGDVLAKQHEYARALDRYREALAIERKLAAQDATNADWQRDLGEIEDKTGQMLEAQGDPAGAAAGYRTATTVYQKLVALSADDLSARVCLAATEFHLGRVALGNGGGQPADAAEARSALEQAKALMEQLEPVRAQLTREDAESLEKTAAGLKALSH